MVGSYDDYINAQDVDFETIYEKSTKKGKHKNNKETIRIKKSIFKKAAVISIALLLGGGALGGSFIDDKIENFSAEREIHSNIQEMHKDYIAPNTHRTDDNQNYWYDTDKIADYVYSTNNPDELIYYCYQDMGTKSAGEIVQHKGYDNFAGYVSDKGFEDVEAYEDEMHDQLVNKYRIKDEQKELNEMAKESNLQILDDSNAKGVK